MCTCNTDLCLMRRFECSFDFSDSMFLRFSCDASCTWKDPPPCPKALGRAMRFLTNASILLGFQSLKGPRTSFPAPIGITCRTLVEIAEPIFASAASSWRSWSPSCRQLVATSPQHQPNNAILEPTSPRTAAKMPQRPNPTTPKPPKTL